MLLPCSAFCGPRKYLDAIDVEQLADGEDGTQAERAVDEHADRGLERADVAEVPDAA